VMGRARSKAARRCRDLRMRPWTRLMPGCANSAADRNARRR
jgi:hypothetical protein